MSRPVLYIAITNHGFGHTVRSACAASLIKQMMPDVLLVLVTTAPRWLLESYIQADFIYRPRAFDVGVIQSDSINMDYKATLSKMQDFRSRQNQIVAGEVNFIKTNKVSLILADIPAIAAQIAQSAGIPCWMMSNFGWDFIYRDWGEEFTDIADWITECYQKCDRLFRFPFYEQMNSFTNITDVGLIGGNPNYSESHLRETFGIKTPKEKTILLSFGGLGLHSMPYHVLANFPDWQFIAFDYNAPLLPNLVIVRDNKYRPVDFMPLCGRVVSKPGFSTFAESLRLDVPIVTLTREGFAESKYLIEGLEKYGHHQIIPSAEFFQGNWDFLHSKPNHPKSNIPLLKDGGEVIAKAVVDYLNICEV
jgi:hypothetical protein